jgi:hypothetical protein
MMNGASGQQEQYGPRWLEPLGWAVAIILFFVGIWSVPLAIFGPDRALVPGDLGDARFNNYILEHFHRYITGRTGAYWDAPFMYPWKNVIALSDNLLGTAPFYSAFRTQGFSREGAFQAWILSLFALNYWCCLIAFRKWGGNWILAACSAYIFAFGIYNIGQMNNLQMLPKFMVPLAFLFFWKHLSKGSWKYLLLAVLATVYQFYCGVYLGFMLAYALFFLFIGHVVIYRSPSYIGRFREWRFAIGWLGCAVVGLLLLMPMMLPYIQVAKDLGTRSFAEVVDSIPRPSSYFFTHPAALSWRALNEVGKNAFPLWWSHFLFIGAVPWVALLMSLVLVFSKRIPRASRQLIMAFGIALLLSTLFCLNLDGHTLYALVFKLPGFSALRAIDRFINVQVLFFLLVFVAVLRPLFRKPGAALALSLVLPLLVVQDNRWAVDWTKRFDKHESRKLVQDVERRITREYGGSETWDAIAYEPLRPVWDDHERWHFETITIQLSTMLAAQQLGIPVVNAYSGSYPGNYISFFDNMDHRTLADWCRFNGMEPDRIQEVHGLGIPVAAIDTVLIQAPNGRYVSCDESKDALIIADRAVTGVWENFLRVRTTDGRFAFLAHNGNYLSAEEEDGGRLAATGLDLGDFGLFTVEMQADGSVSFKAHNGRFLSLNWDSGQLFATSSSPGFDDRFRVTLSRRTPR